MHALIRELVHLGLSEKEAAVYLASLELGASTVQDISARAHVNRATTYVMIESLVRRGLMSTVDTDRKHAFVAESPDRLRSMLHLQKQELTEKEAEFARTLPMLMALYSTEGVRPQVQYFEGCEGLKTVRALFLALNGEFIQIVPLDDVLARRDLQTGRDRHMAQFASAGVPFRALLATKEIGAEHILDIPSGEIRFLPAESFPFHAEITLREHTIFMYSYQEETVLSVVITSREIAATMRVLFELAWAGSIPFSSKNG